MGSTGNNTGRRLLIGKITGAHGIKGEVKVISLAADAGLLFRSEGVFTSENGDKILKLKARVENKTDMFIARVEGITDRNQSELLRGTPLYISRDDLPEEDDDEFYLSDLAGMEARLPDGSVLGVVQSVQNFGASDLVDVLRPDGKTQYYPLAEPFLVEINIEEKFVVIDVPEILGNDGQ